MNIVFKIFCGKERCVRKVALRIIGVESELRSIFECSCTERKEVTVRDIRDLK